MSRPPDPRPRGDEASSRAETEYETFFGVPVDELLVDPPFLAMMAERIHAHGGDPQQWPALADQWTCDDCRSTGPGRDAKVCGGEGTMRDGKDHKGCGSSNVWPVGRGLAPDDAAERTNKRKLWMLAARLIERAPVVSRDVMVKAFPGTRVLFQTQVVKRGEGGEGAVPGTRHVGEGGRRASAGKEEEVDLVSGMQVHPVCAFCLGRPAPLTDDNPMPNPMGDIEHKTGCRWWQLQDWFATGKNGEEPAT